MSNREAPRKSSECRGRAGWSVKFFAGGDGFELAGFGLRDWLLRGKASSGLGGVKAGLGRFRTSRG